VSSGAGTPRVVRRARSQCRATDDTGTAVSGISVMDDSGTVATSSTASTGGVDEAAHDTHAVTVITTCWQ